MTYVITNTLSEGKAWAKSFLLPKEKYKVLHNPNQLRGRCFIHADDLFLLTNDTETIQTLIPALCGCQVYCNEKWISKN